MLSCSNSPRLPSRSRCRVSVVTHATTASHAGRGPWRPTTASHARVKTLAKPVTPWHAYTVRQCQPAQHWTAPPCADAIGLRVRRRKPVDVHGQLRAVTAADTCRRAPALGCLTAGDAPLARAARAGTGPGHRRQNAAALRWRSLTLSHRHRAKGRPEQQLCGRMCLRLHGHRAGLPVPLLPPKGVITTTHRAGLPVPTCQHRGTAAAFMQNTVLRSPCLRFPTLRFAPRHCGGLAAQRRCRGLGGALLARLLPHQVER